jgi:N-acetylneuraminic acid mutarotase
MIVWGGRGIGGRVNTGARYNPATNSWTPTSTNGAPGTRDRHTAVWTGTEMIVWGGAGDIYYEWTGGRYNPTTNTWTPMSTEIPILYAGRADHTAVWTGTEMIVWGGHNQYGEMNNGASYDPMTDTWTALLLNNVPDPRRYHTAVWTSEKMIVWGGEGDGQLNTGGMYYPSQVIESDPWWLISMAGAPDPRKDHTAVTTGFGMIVWGGYNDSDGHLNTGGRFWQSGFDDLITYPKVFYMFRKR